jgi:hypothetical protein
MSEKEIMPIVYKGNSYDQKAADLAIYQAREKYYKKLISELVEQTRREVMLNEAEWLEEWCANREHLGAAYQQINDHIALLRQGDSKTDVKITWPNERYHLGEGCREK